MTMERANGLALPVFENFQHGFRVTVFPTPGSLDSKVNQMKGGQTGGPTGSPAGSPTDDLALVSDAQKAVLDLIRQNKRMTKKEIATILKINESAVQKLINNLRTKKLLVRIGPTFGGYWKVTER